MSVRIEEPRLLEIQRNLRNHIREMARPKVYTGPAVLEFLKGELLALAERGLTKTEIAEVLQKFGLAAKAGGVGRVLAREKPPAGPEAGPSSPPPALDGTPKEKEVSEASAPEALEAAAPEEAVTEAAAADEATAVKEREAAEAAEEPLTLTERIEAEKGEEPAGGGPVLATAAAVTKRIESLLSASMRPRSGPPPPVAGVGKI